MTRREEIEQQAEMFRQPYRGSGNYSTSMDIKNAFQEGAKWADKTMIDKACKCLIKFHNWPTQYEEYARLQEEFIKEFRKAMEEQYENVDSKNAQQWVIHLH